MTSFDSTDFSATYTAETLSDTLGLQDPGGLLRLHIRQKANSLPSICFSEIDQAFLIWGAVTLIIFALPQFSTLSWATQAILDAALTGAGIATTSRLTWELATTAKLRWVIFLWAGLMSAGVLVTSSGIFYGSSLILSNLCGLWLGLCATGYGAMAMGMRSRCFSAAAVVHGLAIAGMSYHHGWQFLHSWQFLSSGLVMALTLFFFSVVPWDMQASENDIPC
ncbi:MAG: hypothetical protein WA984_14055 [Phormidesmis sp.]